MERSLRNTLKVFNENKLSKLRLRDKDFEIELERSTSWLESGPIEPSFSQELVKEEKKEEPVENRDLFQLESPLVGVYYEAANPEAEPYVKEGDRVEKGQVLCIVEAMKMINEIKSPVSGVIKKINFKNEETVEYKDVLMEIDENV